MDAIIAIRTFDELRVALRKRKADLGLNNLAIDDIAGLQGGYTGKLMVGIKRPGDMSLPALLGALKCHLVLVPSTSQHGGSDDISIASEKNLKKVLSARGKKGGRAWARKTTAEQRRALARKGGLAKSAKAKARLQEVTARGKRSAEA
jgi:hypothetical protein